MGSSLRKDGIVAGTTILLLANGVSTVAAVQTNSDSLYPVPVVEKANVTDCYENGYSEEVIIDGDNYIYNYAYENGNKVINILNETTGITEKITYNEKDSTIYHNDVAIGLVKGNSNVEQTVQPMDDVWTTISNDSYYVSWSKEVSVAVVAGAIAIYVGTLGPAGIIAAMGSGAISIIAASSVGGTVRVRV